VLSEWEHCSRNVMVSVGVSRMGKIGWSSSILERQITAHTRLLQYRPREGSAAWHQSNMSSLQVDAATGWGASAHRPDHDRLSEKRAHKLVESICDPKLPNPPKIPSKGFIISSDSAGHCEFQKKVSINRTPGRGLICIFSRWPPVKPSTYYYVFMVGFTPYRCISNI